MNILSFLYLFLYIVIIRNNTTMYEYDDVCIKNATAATTITNYNKLNDNYQLIIALLSLSL